MTELPRFGPRLPRRAWSSLGGVAKVVAAVERITKRYGEATVVDAVSLDVASHEVHIVAGENGAGKSTVLKMLAGLVLPDAGRVTVGGRVVERFTPIEAISRGVALVSQHFALVETLTALENVVLAAPPRSRFGASRASSVRAEIEHLLSDLGTSLDLDRKVATLGVGERQRLEIVRALYRRADIVLLDEPTAVLSPVEVSSLYAMLRTLATKGKAVVVVTHKLDEIERFADRVTVLRGGKKVLDLSFPETRTADESASLVARVESAILGEHAQRASSETSRQQALGDEVLRVEGLSVGRSLVDFSLRLRVGEIVGVAGVSGNGQEAMVRALSGSIRFDARACEIPCGVAVVPDDRHREGLCLDASLADNVLLGELDRYSRFGVLSSRDIEMEARKRLTSLDVTGGGEGALDLNRTARSLSGGNQQKIVCARAFAAVERGAGLLLLAQPTRGVDIGAARVIHEGIRRAADTSGVLLVSTEMAELRALATRILVFFRGKAVELSPDASDEDLGHAMLGGAK